MRERGEREREREGERERERGRERESERARERESDSESDDINVEGEWAGFNSRKVQSVSSLFVQFSVKKFLSRIWEIFLLQR